MTGSAAMCDGKKYFTSYVEATKSSNILNSHREDAHSTAYRCPHCLGWHVGNTARKQHERINRSKIKQELRNGGINLSSNS